MRATSTALCSPVMFCNLNCPILENSRAEIAVFEEELQSSADTVNKGVKQEG